MYLPTRPIGHLVRGMVHAAQQVVPGRPVDVAERQVETAHDVGVEALLVQHLRDVVDARRVHGGHHRVGVDVAHQRDLALDARRHLAVGTQDDRVGLDADAAQRRHRVLRRLGLELARRADVRQQRHVQEEDVVAAHLVAHLADGLEERQRLDVADRAADLGDDHVDVGTGHAPDARLDLVGDVRDDLDGVAEVLAAPLLGDDRRVHLAGRDVGRAVQVGVEEALVVADVEVGLGAVVGDEHLAVLERVHRPGIDVQVGVELLHGHPQAAGLQQVARGTRRSVPCPERRRRPRSRTRAWSSFSPWTFRLSADHRASRAGRAHSVRVGRAQGLGRRPDGQRAVGQDEVDVAGVIGDSVEASPLGVDEGQQLGLGRGLALVPGQDRRGRHPLAQRPEASGHLRRGGLDECPQAVPDVLRDRRGPDHGRRVGQGALHLTLPRRRPVDRLAERHGQLLVGGRAHRVAPPEEPCRHQREQADHRGDQIGSPTTVRCRSAEVLQGDGVAHRRTLRPAPAFGTSATRRSASASASSSAACSAPDCESSSPESIRTSSRTRSGPSTTATLDAVTCPDPSLVTTTCRSANAATWGRCVTTMTCDVRASRASRRPTSTATRPPIPASTSSNTKDGTLSTPASTTSMASMMRESSPPDAPLPRGRASLPE